jgi:hypothetical protein
VNKVVGNFHFSLGRSFQTHAHHVHDLVPYLKDSNHHDFRHIIHHFAFEGDDEYSAYKAGLGRQMKRKMQIEYNPLDGMSGNVGFMLSCLADRPRVANQNSQTQNTQEMFQYFLKVVSTRFITIKGESVSYFHLD